MRILIPTLAALAAGCLADPHPDDGGQFGEEAGARCEDVAHTPLATDEVSPLGFTGQLVLDLAPPAGLPLRWADGTTTGLSVGVTHTGAVEYVEYEVVDDGPEPGGAEPALTPFCPHQVELEVSIAFGTADGAFDETFATRLLADVAGEAHASVAPTRFDGTFDPWRFAPAGNDYDELATFVDFYWSSAGSSGTVDGQGTGTDGGTAFAEHLDIATWGADNP